MTLTVLRDHTRSSHQSLEKLLIPRLKNIQQQKDYADILALFYGYFQPLEEQIAKHINNQTITDLDDRRKSDALLADYQHVTGNETVLPLCNNLPQINNEAQSLGALYVMEGSTLGGKIITQMVMKSLGITPDEGISFFSGYGDDTEQMWTKFTTALNNYNTGNEHIQQEIAAAAEETFVKFRHWVEEN